MEKIKVYEVISCEYELSDSNLSQESNVFTDEAEAREVFNRWVACAKSDLSGYDDGEVVFEYSEDESENYYYGSREVGTEYEYQRVVEFKEYEIYIS